MPKMKTRSAAKKRFQVKKSGKVKHAKAFAKHHFTFSKTPTNDRRNRGMFACGPLTSIWPFRSSSRSAPFHTTSTSSSRAALTAPA